MGPTTTPGWLGFLERLDRRYVFLFVGISIIVPLLLPLRLPLTPSKQAKDFHAAIESIPNNSTVLLGVDYDPTAKPELQPMTEAAMRHLFSKRPDGTERGIKIIVFSLWPAGPPLADRAIHNVAIDEFHKTYGVDYVNLGFKEGREIVMANMGASIPQVWPRDYAARPISDLPMMAGIQDYSDIAFLVDISGGYPGIKEWVQQAVSIYGLKMAGGTTGVSAPEYYPYYQSGQMLGLLEGLKGAAEYETLVGKPGRATSSMDAQSTGHWMIVFFILLGNVIHFLGRRSRA